MENPPVFLFVTLKEELVQFARSKTEIKYFEPFLVFPIKCVNEM
jgi:hypothetical protein